MNFNLSEEQAMLAEAVSRLFEREHDVTTRQRRLAGEPVRLDGQWARLAEMGVLGIGLPAPYGAMDLSAHDIAIPNHLVAQAMGRTLATDPFVSCCVVAAPLLARLGDGNRHGALLHAVAAGTARIALAQAEEGVSGADLATVRTQAQAVPGGWRIDGKKIGVMDAQGAGHFIVAARTEGAASDAQGISLFLVPADLPGMQVTHAMGFDGGDVAVLAFDKAEVAADALLGQPGEGFAPMQHAVHLGMAALASEASGAMDRLIALSIEHLKTRKQFGQPLAQFQSLQHHIAGMATALEQVRSMVLYAASACAWPDAARRSHALSSTKVLAGQESLSIGKLAVQLHGGMGMTDEVQVGHFFRRLIAINAFWGTAEEHLTLCADALRKAA